MEGQRVGARKIDTVEYKYTIIRTKFGIRLPSPLRGFAQILQVIPHLCMGRNRRLAVELDSDQEVSVVFYVCERYLKPFAVAPLMYVIAGGSSGSTWPNK